MDEATRERKRIELEEASRLFDASPARRAARLAELDASNQNLSSELRALLACADEIHAIGEDNDDSPGSRVGNIVSGRFRLVRLLGSGGMGEVYLAQRTDDVDRQVALKLMRSDLPVPIERARRERQILARLIHPNIAGLVDAGLAEFGQPWFAMDFVDGEAITAWCDHHSLDLHARARLMAQVCRAVQFAHRNLVLHRDIKPSNILVDNEGVPKLLDFGVAKLLDATDEKQTQMLALTPAYAAPEQLRGDPATTASDVYQLGLVLYELLTGVSARKARESASPRDRIDTPLPRVDLAIATEGKLDHRNAERIATERRLGLDKLRRSLKGDLARIVSKATAEDIQERYATAQALADDLDRWVDGLPVAAHRGSFSYQASKFLRRHSVASIALAALASGLVAVSVVAVRQSVRDRAERKHAETLLSFMQDIFRQADPQNAKGENFSAVELLERASSNLDNRTDIDVQTLATLKTRVADTFNALNQPERGVGAAKQAVELLEPTRASEPSEYLGAGVILLDALQLLDRSDEQLQLADHLLTVVDSTGAEAALWRGRLSNYRGDADCKIGKIDACSDELNNAISSLEGSDNPAATAGLSEAFNLLQRLRADQGNAVEAHRLVLRGMEVELGSAARSLDLAISHHNLAVSLYSMGKYRQAISLLTPLLTELPKYAGADASIAAVRVSLLLLRNRSALGEYDIARAMLTDATAKAAGLPMLDPRFAVGAEFTAAKFAMDLGDIVQAETALQRATSILAAHPRGLEMFSLRVQWLRAETLLRANRCDEAQPLLLEVRSTATRTIGSAPSWTLGEIEDSLARCELANRDFRSARATFERAAEQFRQATGAESPSTLRSEVHLLWAEALATRDPTIIGKLEKKRAQLAMTLGPGESIPLWQLDHLIEMLAMDFAPTRASVKGLETSAAHITAAAGRFAPVLLSNGINSFD